MIPEMLKAKPRGPAPTGYKPPSEIILCSNLLRKVNYIFEVASSVHPILIGEGAFPRVWLASPTSNARQEWKLVVDDNEAIHPAFLVRREPTTLTIMAGATVVLRLTTGNVSPIVVTDLDLRPIGLNITGSRDRLLIGNHSLSENEIANSQVAFGVGPA